MPFSLNQERSNEPAHKFILPSLHLASAKHGTVKDNLCTTTSKKEHIAVAVQAHFCSCSVTKLSPTLCDPVDYKDARHPCPSPSLRVCPISYMGILIFDDKPFPQCGCLMKQIMYNSMLFIVLWVVQLKCC